MQFTLFLICNWNQEGVGASFAWCLENAHIILNIFQNRCLFLYNNSAFFHFLITWYHLITQKENGNEDKVIYFALNQIILIRKCFFTSAYFSPFDLKSSLNQKLSRLKKKVCFCDWQIVVSIFSNVIRLQLSPNR